MIDANTPQKTGQGWVIDIPPAFAQELGVAEGSIALLHARQGQIEVEILPPPTPELEAAVQRIQAKYQEVFEELKRLGD
ncbi:MAG: hypothetical protein AB1757_18610 [Acidobacteriota bacterium]